MLFQKKNRFKPIFKKLIRLRENILGRTKLLQFKKKKWEIFKSQYLKTLKKYKKFKPQDHTRNTITKYPSKGTSHKKQYRNTLNSSAKLRLFYGGLSKKKVKSYIDKLADAKKSKLTHINLLFLKLFESRLDTVLFRAKFAKSLRDARQLITHCKIEVNNTLLKSPSYSLKNGDLVSVRNGNHPIIEENFKYYVRNWISYGAQLWPLPPKHLILNYTTMEIFFEDIDVRNLSNDFLFRLNLEKIIFNSYR